MANNDEKAFEILNADSRGAAVIVCEHASNHFPARYRNLGLSETDRQSHAAWDPGAEAVAQRLSQALDAPLIVGRVSRLVYDCNRPPEAPGAMPERSEVIDVPGNVGLSDEDRAERVHCVYDPFTTALGSLLTRQAQRGTPPALITVHSFTPLWFGEHRSVEIGILHDDDSRLADEMLARAESIPGRKINRNDPYGPADGVTHTLRLHGLANNLANVMIEVRNDLIETPAEQDAIAEELLTLLRPALARLTQAEVGDA